MKTDPNCRAYTRSLVFTCERRERVDLQLSCVSLFVDMGCGSSAMSKERFKLSESSFVTLKALAKRFDLKRSDLEKFRVVFAAVRALPDLADAHPLVAMLTRPLPFLRAD